MRALPDDFALVKYDDFISIHNRVDTLRHNQHSFMFHLLSKRAPQPRVSLKV